MPRKATANDLLWVSKSKREQLSQMKAGVSLVQRTGYDIDELVSRATKDRLALGKQMLASAQSSLSKGRPENRQAISRAYYATYHIFRAVVFYVAGGDDYEKHSELPKHVPSDFPQQAQWVNLLKDARLERNKADYDPYPRRDTTLARPARTFVTEATRLLPVAKRYLLSKGAQL